MHMADALVSTTVALTMDVASLSLAAYSVKKIKEEDAVKKIPVMGVMGAFVFAAQMLNFTIPGTGASGHLCGGMLISALVGPYAGFLTMISVLLVQCLLFADGGLLALGCNIFNMAFFGCFVGSLFIWKPIMKKGITRTKIVLASVLGAVLTLQMGAFCVTLETLASGITELPFKFFVAAMQPIHLIIGTVEGLIISAVLLFIFEARPEILWMGDAITDKPARLSFKNTLGVIAVSAIILGAVISLFASSFPDGLEWAILRLTGVEELSANGSVHQVAESIQSSAALLPDYSFEGSDSMLGTSFSGVVGAIAVVLVSVLLSALFRFAKRKTN